MMISPSQSVRDLAVAIPGATSIFENFQIDYCCGGAKSLADACAARGVALDQIVPKLQEAIQNAQPSTRNWTEATSTELIRHLLDKHHVYTRNELDRLDALTAKVARVHGEKAPELVTLRNLFLELNDELQPHLMKEERVLFPFIETIEAAVIKGEPAAAPFFGTVNNPIRMMNAEHDHAGEILRRIREVTSNFTLPTWACGSFEAMYAGLAALEADLHEHIHLENNVLFPNAIELEKKSR